MYRLNCILFSILFPASLMLGQTMVDLRTQSKSVDFSAASATKPFKSGPILPATCLLGEMFYNTSSPAGMNLYGCTALNSWTLQGGSALPGLPGNGGKILSSDGVTLSWGALAGDVTGLLGATTVTQLQNRPVASTVPASGQSLVWNGAANRWEPQTVQGSSGTTLPGQSGNTGRLLSTDGTNLSWAAFAGDVTGLLGSTTVTQLQNRPVSAAVPAGGQSLIWNASTTRWEPATSTLAGDVSGLLGATTVTQLQNRPVASTTPASGQSLVWNGATNRWEPQTVQSSSGTTLPGQSGNTGRLLSTDGTNLSWGIFGGDVTGLLGATTVTQLQNRPVASTVPASGQSLVWNGATSRWEPQTVQGSSGTTLPGQSGNTGKLLSTDGTNLSWSAFAGDVTGPLGATTVTQLQNRPVSATIPTGGQALVWNASTGKWEPATSTLAGDVSGLLGATTVTQLQNRPVASTIPASGQSLVWNGATSRWEPQTVQGSSGTTLPGQSGNTGKLLSTDGTNLSWSAFAGDVTGPLGATTVTQLQNRPVASTVPASGQSLVWNGATSRWEPQTVQGSSGTTLPGQSGNTGKLLSTDGTNLSWSAFAGDVTGPLGSTTVTQIQNRPVSATIPTGGQSLVWNASTSTWEPATSTLAGDVSGLLGATTVTQLQNRPVSAAIPSGGQSLVWNATTTRWEPATSTLAGDVSGLLGATTVTQLQNRPVASTVPASGQSLVWNGATNRWEPQTVQGSSGTTLPGQSGNTGKLLSTDGTNLSWSAFAGDVTGPLGATTVTQIQNRPVSSVGPSGGQALVWNESTSRWEPQAIGLPNLAGQGGTVLGTSGGYAFWMPLAGDVSGVPGGLTVTKLQNHPVATTLPASGQSLVWNGTTSQWEPQTVQGGSGTGLPGQAGNSGKVLSSDGASASWSALGGDVSGTPAAMTVTQLQSRAVSSAVPLPGQALVWNGASWLPQAVAGGSGISMANQLGDLNVVRSSATSLIVGAACSTAAPCNVRFGSVVYSFTNSASVTVTGGTGLAFIYVSGSGALTVGHNLSVTCSAGCTSQTGITGFPADSVPLYAWTAGNGAWDATGGADVRSFMNAKNVVAGTGIITADSLGKSVVSVDPAVVIMRRVTGVSDGTRISPNAATTDLAIQSNTQAAGTLTIDNPSGTPSEGQSLIVRIKSTNVQTLAFGSAYRGGSDLALVVATTGAGKTDYLKFMWNATDTTWDFVAKTAGF